MFKTIILISLHRKPYCISVFNTLRKICYAKNVVFSVVVSNIKSCKISSIMIIFFIKELIVDSGVHNTAIIYLFSKRIKC